MQCLNRWRHAVSAFPAPEWSPIRVNQIRRSASPIDRIVWRDALLENALEEAENDGSDQGEGRAHGDHVEPLGNDHGSLLWLLVDVTLLNERLKRNSPFGSRKLFLCCTAAKIR